MHRSYGLQHLRHKRRNIRFKGLRRVHQSLTAHTADHRAKQGRFGRGVVSLPSERFTRFGNPAWPGVRTAYFAAFGSWPGGALEERRKPSGQRCAYACRCPEGVAAPLGCVIFFASAEVAACTPFAQGFLRMRKRGWHHYPQRTLRVVETLDGRLSKRFVCRFHVSPIYICERPRRVLPISASIQIACCWISRGHIACPWLIQA